jgi:hypothetical protein
MEEKARKKRKGNMNKNEAKLNRQLLNVVKQGN